MGWQDKKHRGTEPRINRYLWPLRPCNSGGTQAPLADPQGAAQVGSPGIEGDRGYARVDTWNSPTPWG